MVDWRVSGSVALCSMALLPLFALIGLPDSLWMLPYVTLGVCILCLAVLWRKRPRTALLIGSFGVGAVVASYVARAPPMGVYGYDSNITISILERVLDRAGLVEALDGPIRGAHKVENYPTLYLTGAVTVATTGLTPMLTTKTLPLIFLPLLPLLGYAITPADTLGKVAGAALWTVPTFYMSHSGAAVPQQFGLVLFGVFFFLIAYGYRDDERARQLLYWATFLVTTGTLVLSHSLTPFIAVLVMPIMFVLVFLQPRQTKSRVITVLYSLIAVGIWVFNETRIVFVEGIFALVSLIGSGSGTVSLTGRKPGQIALLPLPLYRYPISWATIFGRLPLYLAAGLSSLFVLKKYVVDRRKDVDVVTLAMFFGGGITLLAMVVGPASTKRGWIFLSLLSGPGIGYMIYSRGLFPESLRTVLKFSLVLAVVVSTFAIPMNTFTPDAEPESLTGRDLYPGEEVHGSTAWLNAHTDRSTSAVTGTRFFMFEERYRHPTQGLPECYTRDCPAPYVFWHDDFREGWFNQDLGTFHQFPDGVSTLTTRRNRIFDGGRASIYQ